jgi:DNA-binding NtrC family response regulator
MCQKKQILVVDDDQIIRDILSTVLTDAGYEVFIAENINDALSRYLSTNIDIIISDVFMPDGNANDMILEIKQYFPKVKVLLISGFANANKIKEIPFIQKPFSVKQIISTVEELLNS